MTNAIGVDRLRAGGVSVTQGCSVMKLARSTYYSRPDPVRRRARAVQEAAVLAAVEAVVAEWPAYGYRRVTHELKRRGGA